MRWHVHWVHCLSHMFADTCYCADMCVGSIVFLTVLISLRTRLHAHWLYHTIVSYLCAYYWSYWHSADIDMRSGSLYTASLAWESILGMHISYTWSIFYQLVCTYKFGVADFSLPEKAPVRAIRVGFLAGCLTPLFLPSVPLSLCFLIAPITCLHLSCTIVFFVMYNCIIPLVLFIFY